MIYESSYWKRDLLKLSRKLTKRKLQSVWSDSDFAEFEKEIMFGFCIIRKLLESYKLSSTVIFNKLKGRKIPNNGKTVHLMNSHLYLNFYDFVQVKPEKFEIRFLLNQIIHSYVFFPYFSEIEEGCLEGIHFNSDKNRNDWLYELNIDVIISSFKIIGNDYPADVYLTYNKDKKDYIVKSVPSLPD